MDKRGEYQDLPSKISCLTVPKIFVGEPFSVSLISGIEKLMPVRGISRFSIENLLSHSTKKLRRGTLLCFTKFRVAKKFMDKRGEYQDLPSKISCLTVPKIFIGEPLSISLISGIEKC